MGSCDHSFGLADTPVAVLERDVDRWVVRLGGEHDISTEIELRGLLARTIGLGESTVVVDLGKVQFMDASTLHVLEQASNILRISGRALNIREASGPALRVINLCGLHALVDRRGVDPGLQLDRLRRDAAEAAARALAQL